MLTALAALLAVVAASVVAGVFGGGGAGSPSPLPSATPAADARAADEALVDADAPDGDVGSVVPTVTYETFLARDPFDPVVPEPEEPVAVSDPSDPNVVDPTDPNAPVPVLPGDPSDPSNPRCVGQEELVCDGQVVTLLDTMTIDGQPAAVIQVGTTVYEVVVGQRFAGMFVLTAVDPPSATILYGDESNVLLEGHSILK